MEKLELHATLPEHKVERRDHGFTGASFKQPSERAHVGKAAQRPVQVAARAHQRGAGGVALRVLVGQIDGVERQRGRRGQHRRAVALQPVAEILVIDDIETALQDVVGQRAAHQGKQKLGDDVQAA